MAEPERAPPRPRELPRRGQADEAAQEWQPGRGLPNPLLEHAVNDRTLAVYRNEETAFKDWLRAYMPECAWYVRYRDQPRDAQAESLDNALVDYLAWLWQRGEPVGRSGRVMSAMLHFQPALRGSLPLAARACASWRRCQPAGEGGPISEAMSV